MALFDARRHGAAHANPVTAHDHVLFLPPAVEINGLHGLAVLRPELEDMPHLDAPGETDFPAAARTGIGFPDDTQIGKLRHLEIPLEVDVFQVIVLLVGPHDHVAQTDQ